MKTKNIALLIWNTIDKEMKRTKGKTDGSDTVFNGEGAFEYKFSNNEIKGKIIIVCETKVVKE